MFRTASLLGSLALAALGLTAGPAGDTASPGSPRPAASTQPAAVSVASFTPASFRFSPAIADELAAGTGAPVRLTASDGTGLSLVALEANGVLEPPLAFTELHLTFENPRDQVIEGRFQISLPPGAALSRFALKIGDSWQEGEVVERQRARQAYEDFLHRRQDPALLEQEAGNEFSARVFPIPARGRKELIVSWSHALTRGDEPYVLPLLGLSQIGRLDIRVLLGDRPAGGAAASNLGGEVSDRRVIELHKRDWTPDRDFEIGQDAVANRAGLRHANLALVRVAPEVASEPQEIGGLYVLIDSSASRALGWATQVRRLTELLAGLRDGAGSGTPVGVAAFDQEVVPVFEGTAGGFGTAEAQRLGERRALGASDLQGALAWLSARLAKDRGRYPRVLLLTDGVATAGDTDTKALKAAVAALGAAGVERLDALAVGGLRDDAVLHELVTGNLKQDGQRIDGAASLAEISRRLTLACRSGIPVAVEGAAWVWPATLDGVQPGDQALVYADVPEDRPVRLTLGGTPVVLGELASAEKPLLEREWAQARIERLLHLRDTDHAADEDLRRAIVREVTDLSVRYRVLSPYTALLVLETEFDYERYGLDRRALADILTVGPGGLDVLARKPLVSSRPVDVDRFEEIPPAKSAPAESAEEVPGDVEEGVADGEEVGVEGGVEGGVPGGVASGVVGGVPATAPMDVPPPPAPPPIPASPRVNPEVPAPTAADEAPLRVGGRTEDRPEVDRRTADRDEEKEQEVAPYSGRFAEVMAHLAAGRVARARTLAETWSAEEPGDVLALLALGEAWEAAGEPTAAARAYGSLIDLFPSRADLRRLAGERLERLGEAGLGLAIDTYQKAVLDRPDHPSGHRLLAWALLRAGRIAEAFAALEEGIEQKYPGDRFLGADRILREDLGLLGAAWLRAEPSRREEVLERLEAHDAELESEPSLRFVLTWETDANDVDLHIWDRQGGHAFYNDKELPSGGELYDDVTTGYGPECFTVRGPLHKEAMPYHLRVNYYNRGPMGYGMGTVQVVTHDGKGGLTIEPRPFVVMADDAMVDLGLVKGGKGR